MRIWLSRSRFNFWLWLWASYLVSSASFSLSQHHLFINGGWQYDLPLELWGVNVIMLIKGLLYWYLVYGKLSLSENCFYINWMNKLVTQHSLFSLSLGLFLVYPRWYVLCLSFVGIASCEFVMQSQMNSKFSRGRIGF